MLEDVTLEGTHVRLEPMSLHHIPVLVLAANQSRETYTYTGVPADEVEMRRYIATALAGKASNTILPFATIDKVKNRVVCTTRLANIEFWNWPASSPHQRGVHLPDVAEIGWTWLASEAQRTGINTEAKLVDADVRLRNMARASHLDSDRRA